jgi:hypothetical protein
LAIASLLAYFPSILEDINVESNLPVNNLIEHHGFRFRELVAGNNRYRLGELPFSEDTLSPERAYWLLPPT